VLFFSFFIDFSRSIGIHCPVPFSFFNVTIKQ
jgi:hypothetical protein